MDESDIVYKMIGKWRFEFWITLAVWALPLQVCIRPDDIYGFQFLCFNFQWTKEEYK
jgi:hypothetical protein